MPLTNIGHLRSGFKQTIFCHNIRTRVDWYYEQNIDKGQGMYQLSNLLNITTDQMMAFGDNYNDIEMLFFW